MINSQFVDGLSHIIIGTMHHWDAYLANNESRKDLLLAHPKNTQYSLMCHLISHWVYYVHHFGTCRWS
jgi:hypothetical protein